MLLKKLHTCAFVNKMSLNVPWQLLMLLKMYFWLGLTVQGLICMVAHLPYFFFFSEFLYFRGKSRELINVALWSSQFGILEQEIIFFFFLLLIFINIFNLSFSFWANHSEMVSYFSATILHCYQNCTTAFKQYILNIK